MHVLLVLGQVLVGPTVLSLAANFVFGLSTCAGIGSHRNILVLQNGKGLACNFKLNHSSTFSVEPYTLNIWFLSCKGPWALAQGYQIDLHRCFTSVSSRPATR